MSMMMLLAAVAPAAIEVDEVITIHHRTIEENLSLDQANLGSSLVVIDRQQIEQFGQSDINDVLAQLVPGLFAAGRNGRYDASYYSLQGSRKQDILWLIDGNRLNNRLYGGIYLDSLNPNIIERIEVLKGGQGIVYGSDAIAGVINIVTRNYQGEDQASVGVGVDTLPSYNLDGFISKEAGDLEWSLFGSVTESEGHQLWDDSEIHWTAADDVKRGYQVYNLGTKLRYLFDFDASLTVLAQYNDGDLERLRPYATVDSSNHRKEQILTVDYQQRLADNWQVQVKGYYHGWDSYYSRIDQTEQGELVVIDDNSYWGFEDFGAKFISNYQGGALNNWLIGAELQRYRGEDEVMEFVSETETVTSGFVQYRPTFDNTELALGLRYSNITDAGDSLDWSISGQHHLRDNLSLNSSVATGFRLPSAEELYSIEEEGGLIGNPDLTPESSLGANLGLNWQLASWRIEPLLYWRKVEDLIGLDGNQFKNLEGEVETKGVELITATGGERWQLEMAGSYSQSRQNGQSYQISAVPEWLGSADFNYQLTDAINLWTQAHYTGEFTDKGKQAGDYWLFHLGASWTLNQHRLSLRVENLLDEDYVVSIFNPGTTAPDGHKEPIETQGLPRNLQLNYRYQF